VKASAIDDDCIKDEECVEEETRCLVINFLVTVEPERDDDQTDPVERRRLSETSCRKYQLIDCYESAKLPVYIPKRKVGTQPLIRSLHSGSPGAERGFQS
jgi:hypothetical protein